MAITDKSMVLNEKIVAVDAWHCKLPVNARRDHGVGSVIGTIDIVVVRVTSESGVAGFGEASPWPVFNGSAEASLAAFDRYYPPHMLGKPVSDWASIMRIAEKALVHCYDAKAALESALLDLAGKLLNVPVSVLLGGKVRSEIPLSVSIANPDFNEDIALAERIHADGVRIVKLKTGFKSHAFDIERIEYFKKHYPDTAIRIDYNQGLDPVEALKKVKDVDAMEVSFIEQPVAAHHYSCMHRLKEATAAPLLADESVFSTSDMIRAVDEDICDAVSVKIMKCGGLSRGKEIAAIAEAAGLAAYGGDMFESGLAHMAGAQMIATCDNISLGCEFYQARYYLEQDILLEPFPCDNGVVSVPDTPGLGVLVDVDLVQTYSVNVVQHSA